MSPINISVRFSQPLWLPYTYEETVNLLESYSHVISIDGGFKTATISFQAHEYEIDEWLEKGLARHVEVFGPENVLVWEGIVNEVDAVIGTLSVKRGPLFSICNRCSVVYTPYLDVCVDPMTTGTATETTIAEDETSQERYGILEDIVSGGTLMDDMTHCSCDDDPNCVPDNEAEAIRDAYLMENKYPETSQSLSIDQTNTPKLTINCVGYGEFLKKYIYNQDEAGTIVIPDKIISVLAAEPNHVFSTNMDYIARDAIFLQLTPSLEDQNRTAEAIIQALITQGDGADNRTFFGFYEGRIPHYNHIPDTAEYQHEISEKSMRITLPDGTEVRPWNVRPGKWVLLTDFMIGKNIGTVMRLDPRNVFIESVTYTAPFGLAIQGSKVGTVKQLMAKYGTGAAG